jgi:hypothetical protein
VWVRVVVGGGFLVVWLLACLADWFLHPEEPILPGWFNALGILVLGYLLGLDLIALVLRRKDKE